MRRFFSMLMIIAIGIMVSNFAEARGLSAAQKKGVVENSLTYALQTAQVSAWPQSVISQQVGPWKAFKPVERASANGIKFTTWPIKVSEGSGVVLSSVNMGIVKSSQKYALSVSYTVYAYFNETEDLKFEVTDVKLLSNQQIQ